jgi:hypothetical protein
LLVAATDDLRCEVEWQLKQSTASEALLDEPAANDETSLDEDLDSQQVSVRKSKSSEDESLLTPAGRLAAFERSLCGGRRGTWSDEWAERDDCELPVGRVISVTGEIWSAMLDIRPAHVIDFGCCCEEGEGSPYLLAWETESEYLLRELSDEEARRLQILCLAKQEAVKERLKKPIPPVSNENQLGLF